MLATGGGTPEQLRLAGVQLEAVRLHPAVNIIYTRRQTTLKVIYGRMAGGAIILRVVSV